MSAPPGSERCEPNLTPLLDMVLQLIMFFMLCANFDKFQKNAAVVLPKAIQAQAPDKTLDVQLLVEMSSPNKDEPRDPTRPPGVGKWSLSTGAGARPVLGPSDLFQKLQIEAQKYGIGKYADANEKNRRKVKVAVILRVDRYVPFRQVYDVMLEVNRAGFEEVQLRALKG